MKIFFNDRIVSIEDARISVLDHGFLYGDGIFESIRFYNGTAFKFDEHLRRLRKGADLIHLNIPLNDDQLKGNAYETVRANNLSDATVRITVTRGEGPLTLDIDQCLKPTCLIFAFAFKPYPESYFTDGINIITADTRRNLKTAINPQVKSANFLNNILAKYEAKRLGAQEALMLNYLGCITECTVSNIFFVTNGVLNTPDVSCGILDGITRRFIIELASGAGIPVNEGQFTLRDVYNCDEVFLTNTTMEVMPVAKIDNIRFKVGEITLLLRKRFIDEVKRLV
ncbi:branched-chain amino acid aminotransferase [Candidatus Magnetoovum chiemensis]|nr:branched-chain amino acid aminotransferase [Candidatus Magnetoovum chiemensis]